MRPASPAAVPPPSGRPPRVPGRVPLNVTVTVTGHATETGSVTCVGASVRGFAQSAARAGWRVHAVDLFGDADLRACAASFTSAAAGRYPDDLPDLVTRLPAGPWCYTGGLENHPHVVERIAAIRPLAGVGGSALRAVRDPLLLGPAVRAAGLGFPDTRTAPDDLPVDGSVLVKPRASAGGRGIAVWRGGPWSHAAEAWVWQRRVAGASWSVAFVCTATAARPWGLSRQLVGRRWCGAGRFAYCGSLGYPLARLEADQRDRLERLGDVLVGGFGLLGLVGVDVIVDAAGDLHVIEVNPRPTASMELVERATGCSLALAHLAACGRAPSPRAERPAAGTWGKAVLFAREEVRFDARCAAALTALAARWAAVDGAAPIADLPHDDTLIHAGRPLLTVFARADDAPAALRRLRERAAAVAAAVSAGEPARR